ncbi:vegetative cell wall protein gp1-like [Ischnura elegans]|uniref:vegetative cell wall protein gp1-like n=1 Tax=Ischnura elegans TaxID=197161 RepID=UPI001ED87F00|nr:vegetative cell wall protein gp1-like [Ischnura elegans]
MPDAGLAPSPSAPPDIPRTSPPSPSCHAHSPPPLSPPSPLRLAGSLPQSLASYRPTRTLGNATPRVCCNLRSFREQAKEEQAHRESPCTHAPLLPLRVRPRAPEKCAPLPLTPSPLFPPPELWESRLVKISGCQTQPLARSGSIEDHSRYRRSFCTRRRRDTCPHFDM